MEEVAELSAALGDTEEEVKEMTSKDVQGVKELSDQGEGWATREMYLEPRTRSMGVIRMMIICVRTMLEAVWMGKGMILNMEVGRGMIITEAAVWTEMQRLYMMAVQGMVKG